MTDWTVVFTSDAEHEFCALPADMQAHGVRIAHMLQTLGPARVREPHVKHLEGKLWEMRLSGRDGIARALYFAQVGQYLYVVRVFVKKTQKTPRREIELALRRMTEIYSHENPK
jgi:phage-related protein